MAEENKPTTTTPAEKKVIEKDEFGKGSVLNADYLPLSKIRLALSTFFSLLVTVGVSSFFIAKEYGRINYELKENAIKIEEIKKAMTQAEDVNDHYILMTLESIKSQDCEFYDKSIQCLTTKKSQNCK